jgi:hypothetical protein
MFNFKIHKVMLSSLRHIVRGRYSRRVAYNVIPQGSHINAIHSSSHIIPPLSSSSRTTIPHSPLTDITSLDVIAISCSFLTIIGLFSLK